MKITDNFDFAPLNDLTDESLARLSKGMRVRSFSRGHKLLQVGDIPFDAIFILEGSVSMYDEYNRVASTTGPAVDNKIKQLEVLKPNPYSVIANCEIRVLLIGLDLFEEVLKEDKRIKAMPRNFYGGTVDWKNVFLQNSTANRLPAYETEEIFRRMSPMKVKKGDVIIRQDSQPDYFYIIAEGHCEVVREVPSLGHSVKLNEYGPGACFGEDSLISDNPRNATATMTTDGLLMTLDSDDFRLLLKRPMTRPLSYYEAKEKIDDGAVWVDVRMPNELRAGRKIPGSICIPFPIARARLFDAKKDTTYIIVCENMKDSPVLTFVLCKNGYDAYYLQGGIHSFPETGYDSGASEQ